MGMRWNRKIAVVLSALVVMAAMFGAPGVQAAAKEKVELPPHTSVGSDGSVNDWSAMGISSEGQVVSPAFAGDPSFKVPAPGKSASDRNEQHVRPAREGDISISSVIGTDSRTRVTSTTTYPYRAIAHITSSIGGCTGWFISNRTVVTAGHCVHSGGSGGSWATNVVVYPGRDGSYMPYGSCTYATLYSVSGWTSSGDRNYDYGAIRLNCTIGDTVGWFGFRYTTSSLVGTAENISGYPGDKTYGTQWQHADKIWNSYTYYLEYQNDTYGGQSGSPVYEKSNSSCSGPCAIAVHTNGGTTYNSGTRITQSVYNNFNNWK